MAISPVPCIKLTEGSSEESTLILPCQLDEGKEWVSAMTVVSWVTSGNLIKMVNRLVQCKGHTGWLKEWIT